MKENRIYKICMLGIIVFIVMFLVTMFMNINDGYARDAGIYVSSFFSTGLWINFLVSILSGIIFFILPRLQNKKIAFITLSVFLVGLFIYYLVINIGWKISYEQIEMLTIIMEILNV